MKHFVLPVAIVVLALAILITEFSPQTAAQSEHTVWEYKTVTIYGSGNGVLLESFENDQEKVLNLNGFRELSDDVIVFENSRPEVAEYLNDLGQEGWEVVSAEILWADGIVFSSSRFVAVVLKRPL